MNAPSCSRARSRSWRSRAQALPYCKRDGRWSCGSCGQCHDEDDTRSISSRSVGIKEANEHVGSSPSLIGAIFGFAILILVTGGLLPLNISTSEPEVLPYFFTGRRLSRGLQREVSTGSANELCTRSATPPHRGFKQFRHTRICSVATEDRPTLTVFVPGTECARCV
jgi:hypothetical protein